MASIRQQQVQNTGVRHNIHWRHCRFVSQHSVAFSWDLDMSLRAINLLSLDCAGLLALLVDLESLAQLVSIGTLFVFFCVCLGCLRRRFYEPGKNSMAPFVWRCVIMTLFNIGAHH
jgi:hypothetical protein